MSFVREIGEIYRLKVPFESVYTSVFFIKTENGNALVDCATTASDVDDVILPALNRLGVRLADIRYLILTHKHGDHAGGKARLLQHSPTLEVVQSVSPVSLKGITTYAMKGHTLDCIGVFDETSGTLIAGDGLQGAGIGKYRCSLESREEYVKTIERIEKDKTIENVLFSHAYEPWYKDGVFGRENVEKVLNDCRYCAKGE